MGPKGYAVFNFLINALASTAFDPGISPHPAHPWTCHVLQMCSMCYDGCHALGGPLVRGHFAVFEPARSVTGRRSTLVHDSCCWNQLSVLFTSAACAGSERLLCGVALLSVREGGPPSLTTIAQAMQAAMALQPCFVFKRSCSTTFFSYCSHYQLPKTLPDLAPVSQAMSSESILSALGLPSELLDILSQVSYLKPLTLITASAIPHSV